MQPNGEEVPSSKLIFRSCSRWGASCEALLLLKTFAMSWYSGGTPERSAGSEVVDVERRVVSLGWRCKLN